MKYKTFTERERGKTLGEDSISADFLKDAGKLRQGNSFLCTKYLDNRKSPFIFGEE